MSEHQDDPGGTAPFSDGRRRRRSWLYRLLPALLYAALIFVLSSIHGHSIPSMGLDVGDKLIHLVEYFVLGFLLIWGFHRDHGRPMGSGAMMAAVAIALVYAAGDEIHQYFVPGRSAEFLDWVADAGGILLALVAYQSLFYLQNRRQRRRSSQPG